MQLCYANVSVQQQQVVSSVFRHANGISIYISFENIKIVCVLCVRALYIICCLPFTGINGVHCCKFCTGEFNSENFTHNSIFDMMQKPLILKRREKTFKAFCCAATYSRWGIKFHFLREWKTILMLLNIFFYESHTKWIGNIFIIEKSVVFRREGVPFG